MKILLINSVCNGSTGHICQDLANDFLANGDDCVIAYARGNAPYKIKNYKISNRLSIAFHVAITRLFDAHGKGSIVDTKRFIRWISKYKPDLIWLHNIHGYYLNLDLFFKYISSLNIPIKWTLHDCWTFTGHCAYFDYVKCDKWKIGCEKCPAKNNYPKSIFLDNSSDNFKRKKYLFNLISKDNLTIITPSIWLSNLVHQSYLSKYRVQVLNNKINKNVFTRTKSDLKKKYCIENKKVILGVASIWEERKGFKDFLELSRKIDDEYIIVLIGLTKNQVKMIPNNVLGISRTENREELVKWYSCAFCFFNPTYEDNYPTVLLEANACGCKTVSYDTGGCSEISTYIVSDVDSFINLLPKL